jgi:hypothetical protein
MTSQLRTVSYLLRIGLAFSFAYAAVASTVNPDNWIWFVPDFVEVIMPKLIALYIVSGIEMLLVLGLLFLPNPTIPAIVAIILLLGVIFTDLSTIDITFRDVSIIAMAAALIVVHRRPRDVI